MSTRVTKTGEGDDDPTIVEPMAKVGWRDQRIQPSRNAMGTGSTKLARGLWLSLALFQATRPSSAAMP